MIEGLAKIFQFLILALRNDVRGQIDIVGERDGMVRIDGFARDDFASSGRLRPIHVLRHDDGVLERRRQDEPHLQVAFGITAPVERILAFIRRRAKGACEGAARDVEIVVVFVDDGEILYAAGERPLSGIAIEIRDEIAFQRCGLRDVRDHFLYVATAIFRRDFRIVLFRSGVRRCAVGGILRVEGGTVVLQLDGDFRFGVVGERRIRHDDERAAVHLHGVVFVKRRRAKLCVLVLIVEPQCLAVNRQFEQKDGEEGGRGAIHGVLENQRMKRAARKNKFGLVAEFFQQRVEEDAFVRLMAISLRDRDFRLG